MQSTQISATFVSNTPLSSGTTLVSASSLACRRQHYCRICNSRAAIRSVTSAPQSPPFLGGGRDSSRPERRTASKFRFTKATQEKPRVAGAKVNKTAREAEPKQQSTPEPSQDDKPPAPLWPRLLVLLVAAVFGTNFPVVKFLQSGADPLPASVAALARFSLASAALMPAALSQLRRPSAPRGVVTSGAIIGLPVFFGYLTQALSLDGTDAGKSAFLCSLAVVFVPLITRVVPSLRVQDETAAPSSPLATWGAPFLAVLGVALLELADASPPNAGDAWGLMQAVAFGTGFLLNERAAKNFPGYSMSISAVQLAVISCLSAVWATVDLSLIANSFTLPAVSEAFSSTANSFGLLYAGLISTALTVVLSNLSLSRVTAGELTVLLSTEPVWAAIFSALFIGERMGSGTALGAVLILSACLVNQADVIPFKGFFKSPVWGVVAAPAARFSSMVSAVQDFFNRLQPPAS